MRAGIDIDGVLYKWEPTARYMLEREFGGFPLTPSQSWSHIQEQVSEAQWEWLWTEGVKQGLFRHGNCYKGALDALKRIDRTQDIVLITTRPRAAIEDTLAWVSFHKIAAREIHILGPGSKKSAISCDWYVDDHLKNTTDLMSTGKPVFLWDRPWNRAAHDAGDEYTQRVYSWDDILEEVQK